MKRVHAFTTRILLIAGLVLSGSLFAFAGQVDSLIVRTLSDKRAVVTVLNPEKADILINVSTKKGLVLFEEQHEEATDYTKVYDFSSLTEGNYMLTVSVGTEHYAKELLVTSNELAVWETTKEDIEKPSFDLSGRNLDVRYANEDANAIKVKFFDGNMMIHEDDISSATDFKRRYDLGNLKQGQYDVVLTAGNKNFYKSIYVK